MILETFIGIVETVIGVFGALFIVYGAVIAIYQLLMQEVRIRKLSYHRIRLVFTTRLLIGLEFFVAADLLRTILQPTFQDLAVLGALVAIRTVVAYFLGREVQSSRKIERFESGALRGPGNDLSGSTVAVLMMHGEGCSLL
jgi:uncharacterized membrane protein